MSTQTTTYSTSGSHTYTASSYLLNGSVQCTVNGAAGAGPGTAKGGRGGQVAGTVTVSPGGTLTAVVGDTAGNGEHAGGTGGNTGGGSSAVLSGASVLVEAGGGGAAGSGFVGNGGAGGATPTSGANGNSGNTAQGGGGGGGHQGAGGNATTSNTGAGGVAPGGGGDRGGSSGGGGAGGSSYAAGGVLSPTYSDGSWSGTTGQVTIVATVADAPYAPSLTGPSNGAYLDSNAVGVTFTWGYNPGTDSGSQSAYALRVSTDGGAYQYWNATSGALQSSIVWNSGSASTVTIPAGKLADGHTYTWSVATQESHYSLQGPFASDHTFTGTTQPTVTVTAPTGTVSSATPTVTWTEVLGSGDAQISYRVVIYTLAVTGQPGFSPGSTTPTVDSGVVSSAATSWTPSSPLAQGQWVAYVQIAETGSVASQWESSGFTIAYTGPSAPAVTVSGGNDTGTGAPTVSVLVDGTGCFSPGGGITLTNPTATVERSADGGVTWTAVRGGTDVTVPTSTYQVTVVDYETPFGTVCTYRATLGATTSSPAGALVYSTPTDAVITITSDQWWLSDPLDTTTALPLNRLGSIGILTTVQSPVSFAKTNSEQIGVFYAFGRKNPIIQRGTKKAPTFALNCWLDGYADKATFDALVGSDANQRQHTLLLRSTMSDAWYVVIGPDIPDAILRASDQVTKPAFVVTGAICTVTDPP